MYESTIVWDLFALSQSLSIKVLVLYSLVHANYDQSIFIKEKSENMQSVLNAYMAMVNGQ